MILTDVRLLDPRMIGPVEKLVRRCAEEGVPVVVTETRRSLAVHIAFWLRSRAPVYAVQAVFARCGLWPITAAEAAVASTQTLYSKHVDGLAVDVAPARDGRPGWAAPLSVWERIWRIAEDECGLDACAGGKWQAWQKDGRPWDLPHIEYREDAA